MKKEYSVGLNVAVEMGLGNKSKSGRKWRGDKGTYEPLKRDKNT